MQFTLLHTFAFRVYINLFKCKQGSMQYFESKKGSIDNVMNLLLFRLLFFAKFLGALHWNLVKNNNRFSKRFITLSIVPYLIEFKNFNHFKGFTLLPLSAVLPPKNAILAKNRVNILIYSSPQKWQFISCSLLQHLVPFCHKTSPLTIKNPHHICQLRITITKLT